MASAPEDGALKREDVCAPAPPPAAGVVVDGAPGAFPKRVFGVLSLVPVAAGLAFPKRLFPVEGAGFVPKRGF